MSGTMLADPVALDADALARLMPLHLIVSRDGRISAVGPTLARLRPGIGFVGRDLFDLFRLRRPRGVSDMTGLVARAGEKIALDFADGAGPSLKGLALVAGEGLILNLGFGISVVEAVRDHRLSAADFAPTDPTVELLYLVEANSAVQAESRDLNLRLQSARIAAEEQAFTDTLTGLKNRRALDHVLARMLAAGRAFALLSLDLDYFKRVNDTLGHAAGDHVLQIVAQVLVGETRPGDLVARVGGDEFALLIRRTTERPALLAMARRLIAGLEHPISYDGRECRISASVGITTSVLRADPTPAQMLEDADRALYASKRGGRAQAALFDAVRHPRLELGD